MCGDLRCCASVILSHRAPNLWGVSQRGYKKARTDKEVFALQFFFVTESWHCTDFLSFIRVIDRRWR